MTDCKYWNESWGPSFAGRCSAPDDVGTNAVNKFCMSPQTCPYLLEPLYKRKSQMKNQEILNALNEKIKAAEEALLYLNQSKAGLERVIANSAKTPAEEAYKDWWGEYPTKTWRVDVDRWNAFQAGYNAAGEEKVEEEGTWNYDPDEKFVRKQEEAKKLQEKELTYKVTDEKGETNPYKQYMNSVKNLQEKDWKVDVKTNLKPHWEPKPQEPEEVAEGLKKAFREAVKQGVVSSNTKPQTLYEICMDWWRDLYSTADMNISIEKLVNRIEKEWLPKPIEETCGLSENDVDWNNGYNTYREYLVMKLK